MLLLLAHMAAAGCFPAPEFSVESDVYVGRNRAGAPFVGPLRWRRFLREVVTPEFPGFTVLESQGFWHDAPESSRVLVILHAPGREEAVDVIADAYRDRFGQEAVLVTHRAVTGLICAAEP